MAVEMPKLYQLARLFAPYATLYAVGGFVRDGLLGCERGDVDVCSKLRVDEVKSILLNSDFFVSDKSLRMGTVHIMSHGFVAEYTTFRKDSYERSSGSHIPEEVCFTDDINVDARRRDFKCNAVYYDIVGDKIVDIVGGCEDIKNRVLSTADVPENVFEADGLRILRLVRFASELGFSIEPATLVAAKANAWRVRDIAPERIRDELGKIFVAETAHPSLCLNGAHLRGLRLLDELGLIDLLLPELASLKGVPQKKEYHLYDVYEHSVKAFELSPPSLRWIALLHDVGKRVALEKSGGLNMHGHDLIGAEAVRGILARLKFSNADKMRIRETVRWHMTDLKGDMSKNKLRRFAALHSNVMEELCVLRDVDFEASRGYPPERNTLREVWEEIKSDGTPLSIKMLKVDGNDLLALGAEGKEIGGILKKLWEETALNPALNDRDKALDFVKKRIAETGR